VLSLIFDVPVFDVPARLWEIPLAGRWCAVSLCKNRTALIGSGAFLEVFKKNPSTTLVTEIAA
jgi:hypothetical protein